MQRIMQVPLIGSIATVLQRQPNHVRLYFLMHAAVIFSIVIYQLKISSPIPYLLLFGISIIYAVADTASIYANINDENADDSSVTLDVTEAPLFFAILVAGERGWIAIAAATLIVLCCAKSPWYNILITLGNRSILYVTLLSILYLLHPNGDIPKGIEGAFTLIVLTILCTAISIFLLAVHVSLATKSPLSTALQEGYAPTAWVSIVPISMGALAGLNWIENPWITVLMIVPLFVAHQAMQAVGKLVTEGQRNSQLSQELQQMNDDLEQRVEERTASLQRVEQNREREVTDAVHDLGHELRIIEAVLLKTDPTSDQGASLFQSAQNILADMLLASQLRGNALQLNPEATDMVTLLADVIHQLSPMFQQAECILRVDLPDDIVFAWCDGPRINRVIKNILHNALIYTLDYQTRAHISITLTASDSMILCTVVDNGPGMTQEQIAKLGAQFVRLQSGAERPDGAGIGLSFCARLLALSDGTLTIASDGPGRGTVVTIALPQVIEDNTLLNERVDDETHDEVTGLARISA